MLAGHAARLAPLTGADADDLIRAIRAAPALLEHAPDTGALHDTLLRVSRLADDPPQVAELDLNPVIVRPDGVIAVDARIRVTSERLADRSCASSPSDRWLASGYRSELTRRDGLRCAGNPVRSGSIELSGPNGAGFPSRSDGSRSGG